MPISKRFQIHTLHGADDMSNSQRNLRMNGVAEEYKQLRKANPADMPLTRTLKWMERLPSEVRPTELLRQYPRVANLIAAAWLDANAFSAYMDSLLHDERGSRRGFPKEVVAELVALKEYYDTKDDSDLTWGHIGKHD